MGKNIEVLVFENPDTGRFTGQIVDLPQIIVEADNREALFALMRDAYDKFLEELKTKDTIVEVSLESVFGSNKQPHNE